MPKEIDSAALSQMNRTLGLAGGGGAAQSILDDYYVNQVIDVGPIVRRSRTIAPSEGLYGAQFSFTHAAANTQTNYIDPWSPGALIHNGYPASVPLGYDVWIVGGGGDVNTAANFSALLFGATVTNLMIGLGVNQSGAAITVGGFTNRFIASDTILTLGGIGNFISNANDQTYFKIGARIRRGQRLVLQTTSTGALIVTFSVMLALLPSGLGQDATT